jgi:hypothetical protein
MTDNPTRYWRFTYTVTIGPDGPTWAERVQDVGQGETMEIAMQQFATAKRLEVEARYSIRGVTVFDRVESTSEEEYQAEVEIAKEARQEGTPRSILDLDDYERKRQQLRRVRMMTQLDRQQKEIHEMRKKWPVLTTTSPRLSGPRRFLYVWLGTVAGMLLCLTMAWASVQIAWVIAGYTNAWVGLVTMVAVYGALLAWWITSTPEWAKRLFAKAFDATGSATTEHRKIS